MVDPAGRFRWATPRDPSRQTFGPAVSKLVRLVTGRTPMPAQQHILDVGLEVLPDGRWAYETVAWLAPRRGGKTTIGQGVVPWQCGRGESVWMTAQTREKARLRFLEATAPIERALNTGGTKRVKRTTGVGNEELRWLSSGGVARPFAPNDQAMHGETPGTVWVDEIWAFTIEAARLLMQAYQPGFLTTRGQEWFTSTEGTETSGWIDEVKARGRAAVESGESRGIAYFENSIPATAQEALELPDRELLQLVAENHPAFGFTFGPEDLEAQLEKQRADRAGFVRSMGNVRVASSGSRVISDGVWSSARTDAPVPDPVGFGVGFDGDEVAVVAAGRDEAGVAVCELVAAGSGGVVVLDGRTWPVVELVDALVARQRPCGVALEAVSSGRDLADELAREPMRVGASDLAAAYSRTRRGLETRQVTFRRSQLLDNAAARTQTRAVGGGRWWDGAGSVPMRALSLAVWAVDHPSEPTGPLRILTPRRDRVR